MLTCQGVFCLKNILLSTVDGWDRARQDLAEITCLDDTGPIVPRQAIEPCGELLANVTWLAGNSSESLPCCLLVNVVIGVTLSVASSATVCASSTAAHSSVVRIRIVAVTIIKIVSVRVINIVTVRVSDATTLAPHRVLIKGLSVAGLFGEVHVTRCQEVLVHRRQMKLIEGFFEHADRERAALLHEQRV